MVLLFVVLMLTGTAAAMPFKPATLTHIRGYRAGATVQCGDVELDVEEGLQVSSGCEVKREFPKVRHKLHTGIVEIGG